MRKITVHATIWSCAVGICCAASIGTATQVIAEEPQCPPELVQPVVPVDPACDAVDTDATDPSGDTTGTIGDDTSDGSGADSGSGVDSTDNADSGSDSSGDTNLVDPTGDDPLPRDPTTNTGVGHGGGHAGSGDTNGSSRGKHTSGSSRSHSTRGSSSRATHKGSRISVDTTMHRWIPPHGRLPEFPQLPAARLQALTRIAATSNTDWSMLAAIAWIDSRWGSPGAAGFIGGRLTDAQWTAFGTDGNGDQHVDRANDDDRLATVAAVINAGGHPQVARYLGTRALARRAGVLSAYYAAVGQAGIVEGLADPSVRLELQHRVLADPRVLLYEGGRFDIQQGRIDPRVLVVIEYIANRNHTVTISSLISGHGIFTASGNVSFHSYGQAVDIAAVDGVSIMGHQSGPHNITLPVLEDVLRLPASMRPKELISLWDLGGPSFALADHNDHIHIGFGTIGQDESPQ